MDSTSRRIVEVPDGIWLDAQNAAASNGETLTDVITIALVDYALKSQAHHQHELPPE